MGKRGFTAMSFGRIWRALLLLEVAGLVACTQSPQGSVEELVKTQRPSFGGKFERRFMTPSKFYVLNGECDPQSYGLFYSYDNSNWTEIPGSCPTGTFAVSLVVNVPTITVYVRAKTKFSYTEPSVATIVNTRPPTAHFMKLASAGPFNSDGTVATQSEMSFMSAETLSNGIHSIKTSLVDIIYGTE